MQLESPEQYIREQVASDQVALVQVVQAQDFMVQVASLQAVLEL